MATEPTTEQLKFRLELIYRVLRKVHDETETWESEDHIGAQLAYLAMALAQPDGSGSYYATGTQRSDAFIAMMRRCFEADDPIWEFIEIEPVTDEERSNGPRR